MAALDEVTAAGKGLVPDIKGFGSSAINFIAWAILLLLFLVVVGVGTWFIVRRMKFNRKIIIFEKINQNFEVTGKDYATQMKMGSGGDTIFYCRRRKKYLPNPTIQTGRRTYWYWIREDGEWINFGPGDFDEDARELHAHFLDKEMRYARTQIQKGLKERYEKENFFAKHAVLIISIAFIATIGIMTFLLFDKWIDLAGVTNQGMTMANDVMIKTMDRADAVLAKMDNICSGGSGLVPGGGG